MLRRVCAGRARKDDLAPRFSPDAPVGVEPVTPSRLSSVIEPGVSALSDQAPHSRYKPN